MLRGEKVGLRAVRRGDVEGIAAWDLDPDTWRLVSDEPWVPRTPEAVLKDFDAGTAFKVDARHVTFAVDVDGAAVGIASLWGIDLHNRSAHVGISLAPDARGKGWGTDAVRLLLRYAFLDRGLHRVQLEALASNAQALASYRRVGFVQEGLLRQDAFVLGRFEDQVVMGVLAEEWRSTHP